MFKLLIAAALAVPAIATTASAHPSGYGYEGRGGEVRREMRECRRELRRADSRWEYRRELRECRRELAEARRHSRRWDSHRHRDDYPRDRSYGGGYHGDRYNDYYGRRGW